MSLASSLHGPGGTDKDVEVGTVKMQYTKVCMQYSSLMNEWEADLHSCVLHWEMG